MQVRTDGLPTPVRRFTRLRTPDWRNCLTYSDSPADETKWPESQDFLGQEFLDSPRCRIQAGTSGGIAHAKSIFPYRASLAAAGMLRLLHWAYSRHSTLVEGPAQYDHRTDKPGRNGVA
jgi:hypothetical protein